MSSYKPLARVSRSRPREVPQTTRPHDPKPLAMATTRNVPTGQGGAGHAQLAPDCELAFGASGIPCAWHYYGGLQEVMREPGQPVYNGPAL